MCVTDGGGGEREVEGSTNQVKTSNDTGVTGDPLREQGDKVTLQLCERPEVLLPSIFPFPFLPSLPLTFSSFYVGVLPEEFP